MKYALILITILLTGCLGQFPKVRRDKYIAAHPETTQRHKDFIAAGTIVKGMTREQVTAARGKPKTKSVYVGTSKTEYWHYHIEIIVFENGKVTGWKTYR